MPEAGTSQDHVLEAVVSGPNGANRLYTCTGNAGVSVFAGSGQQKTETWTFRVGPTLTHTQFHRALGTASISTEYLWVQQAGGSTTVQINSVEADWDDESQRVEVRVEFYVSSQDMQVRVNGIRYSVTILAEL